MSTLHAIATFDFTIPEKELTFTDIKTGLKGYVKKYCFQLEEGDTGYRHFQGRFSLIKKRRLQEIIPNFQKIFPGIHLSPTVKDNQTCDFYVTKTDTRVEGPWSDTDEETYIPRQIREIKELYPWQQKVIELSKIWDTRVIDVIYDPNGNNGKSILTTYMGVYKLGKTLPFVNDYKDIMRMVMDLPTSNCYIIDMPRAINKEKLFQMYSGIETIKSGYAYDDRYQFKDKYFDCPRVFVFTNTIPDFNLLSRDRWNIWTINSNKNLEAFHCNFPQDSI